MKRKKCITITRVEGIFLFLIVAEGVDLVHDLGRIFQKVIRPYVAPDDQTLDQALNRFVAYYEQSELFDLYTHGTGPGIVGVIVNLLKSYLGGCVYSKLERHHTLDPTAPCPLTAYVDKIGKIVNMVVREPEDGELPQGKLAKMEEPVKKDEEKKKKKKQKTNVKFTDRKSSKQVSSEEESEDSEAALVVSSDEEDFTTLTSGDGRKQYRPPDQTRSEARFGANKKKGGNDLKCLKQQLGNVTRKMSNYKTEINRLTKEVDEQRKKLDELGGADTTTKVKPGVSSEGRIGKAALQSYGEWEMSGTGFDPGFVGTQLRQDLESNSEDVQVIEDPDSTTGVGKKKKKKEKKRNIEVVEMGDDDENDEEDDDRVYALLGKSQTSKRRRRISSERSSVAVDGGGSKRVESEGDLLLPEISEDKDLDTLRQERDEVEEKLKETRRKLEEIMWDDKARSYHDVVRVCVQRFHKALMNNLGKGEESAEVKKQRSELEHCTVTEAAEGFKIGVCEDFIERIEKTVLVGEVPENKLNLTKIDNSVNNIVEGFVRDVTFELALPLVVKQEKVEKTTAEEDDDELEIVGYTEATIMPVAIQEVKREPPSPPPALPKNQAEKQVRVPEEHGTPRKEVSEVSEAETSTGGTPRKEVALSGTPHKTPKKKGVSKATEEGESSVQSTPTKAQTEVEETEMDTQDIDVENTQSPEKSDATKAKRSKKTVKSTEECTRRVTRSSRAK